MTYPRYIKRKGKIYGPYYYKSVRDEKGDVLNVYVGRKPLKNNDKPSRLSKPLLAKMGFVLISILVVLAFGISYTSFLLTKEPVHMEAKEINIEMNGSAVRIFGLSNISDIKEIKTARMDKVKLKNKDVKLGTNIVAADVSNMQAAEITLEKTGPVNAILECPAYDFATDSCPEWIASGIPFTDNGTYVSFTVNHFSGYVGAHITIINVQSYPTVGDNWTVSFNTTGYANLTITAVQGTEWSESEGYDLKFLEIRCGSQALNYTWIDYSLGNGSVFVENYSCTENGYETSKVLTGGKHTLEFSFGEDVGYARNFAIYNCTNCSDCNTKIAAATDYDVVQLNTSVSGQSGTCISFGGKDNLTFDCLGNTIDGDDLVMDYGIWLNQTGDGSNNNTVRNCLVTGFYYGLYLSSSSNNILTNITANSNTNYGLYLSSSSSNNTLTDITANSNSNIGLYLSSSSNNTLRNCSIQNNTINFHMFSMSLTNYMQDIDTSNTVEWNRPIYYWVNRTQGEINSSHNPGTIYLINCTNVTVRDVNVSYRNYDGIKLYLTNSTITNTTSSNNNYGLYLVSSSNNTLTNITANSNTYYGLYLSSSSNNTLQNVTASYNSEGGLYLSSSSNNTLQNVTASYNSQNGLYLYTSSNNTINNITASHNLERGIYFYGLCQYNRVNNSRIENNTIYGIYLDYITGSNYPRYNTFWNNYLNNTVNLGSDSPNNLNYWNVSESCTSGTNIIGGPCIGGNYWTDPNGNYSDGCADANPADGICDSAVNLTNMAACSGAGCFVNSTDWLPLAENPPQLVFVSPTLANNSYTQNQSWTYVNVSASETLGACLLNWYNGTWTNVSMAVTGSYCYLNMSDLTNNTAYYFRVYGNDSYGYLNKTEDRQITINLTQADTTPPTLIWSSLLESNNSQTSANKTYILWNFTSSETIGTDGCIVQVNGTNQTGAIDGLNCYYNSTGLTGNVTRCAIGYANDSSNNWNQTEYRCISTNEQQPDVTNPDLWFTSPASNGSTTGNNWLFVNVSANENLNTCLLNWYNGSWQNLSMDVSGSYCYVNMTSLTSGSYYFRVYGNDTLGNMNVTEDRQANVGGGTISIESMQIQPDEGNPGIIINPVEGSNKTANVTVTVTNSTSIDTCEVRIFNSSTSYSNPVFLYTGTIQNCGATCDCFKQWNMEYWRNDGDWNVSVYMNLTTGVGNFTSGNFTYNTLISISVNTSTITFTGIPQQTVNSTNAYPLEIKNTGNQLVNISIKGTDFTGLSNPSYVVGVGNSTYNETQNGTFEQLTNDFVQIFEDLAPAVAKNLFFRAYLPVGFIQQDYQNTIEITT